MKSIWTDFFYIKYTIMTIDLIKYQEYIGHYNAETYLRNT